MEIILVALSLAIGVGIGCAIRKPKTSGVLRIDRSEPDEPARLFLVLHVGVHELSRKKYATFQIKNENYISHE